MQRCCVPLRSASTGHAVPPLDTQCRCRHRGGAGPVEVRGGTFSPRERGSHRAAVVTVHSPISVRADVDGVRPPRRSGVPEFYGNHNWNVDVRVTLLRDSGGSV